MQSPTSQNEGSSADFTGTYYMRKTGEIRQVYEVYLLIECPMHLLNVASILVLLPLIASTLLVHRNLKVIVLSYVMTCFCSSVCRTVWLVSELLLVDVGCMEAFMFIRGSLHNSAYAHLYTISAERLVATLQSHKYEHGTSLAFVIAACLLTYPFGIALSLAKYWTPRGREVSVIVGATFSIIAIAVMTFVYLRNMQQMQRRRCQMNISQEYQMRENIRMSRLFLQVFLCGIGFFAVACFFVLRFSAAVHNGDDWAAIKNGFVYDMCVSLASATMSLILVYHSLQDGRLAASVVNCISFKSRVAEAYQPSKRISFRDFRGNVVQIGHSAEEESQVYFSQLSLAWK